METIYVKKVITAQAHLNAQSCVKCGVIFAMTDDLEERRRADGDTFYCPNGHPIFYTRPELEQLRKDNAALESKERQFRAEIERLTNDVLDKAKEVARLRRHAKAGLCPDCRRHFVNLERHIASKHTEVAS